MSAKFDAARFEFGAQLPEIVDLAVVRDYEAAVGRYHRLMAGRGKVEDGQAPMRQSAASFRIAPKAMIVRTAMSEAIGHRKRVPLELIARARRVECPRNTTHRLVQSPRRTTRYQVTT